MLALLTSVALPGWLLAPSASSCRATRPALRHGACVLQSDPPEAEPPVPQPPQTYDEAEARGFELYQAGEYERAIRLFELATTLPGAGVDYRRTSNQGMIGSATAPRST